MQHPVLASNPVVFFANGIGDAILNLPALRALASLIPDRLTLVTRLSPYNALFRDLPTRRVVPLSSGSKHDWSAEEIEQAAARIAPCDVFVSLVPWQSRSLWSLVELLSPSLTVGMFPGFDVEIPRDYSKHTAELAFDVARAFCPSLEMKDYLQPPKLPVEATELVLEIRRCLRAGTRLLAVHADTLPEKMWEEKKWSAVIEKFLASHHDFAVVLVGTTPVRIEVGDFSARKRLVPAYGLSLSDSLSLVAWADLFSGVDSCMLHVADFSRVPSVGLFGPTSASEFGFLIAPHISIQGRNTMDEIDEGDVGRALEAILADPAQKTVWPASVHE